MTSPYLKIDRELFKKRGLVWALVGEGLRRSDMTSYNPITKTINIIDVITHESTTTPSPPPPHQVPKAVIPNSIL